MGLPVMDPDGSDCCPPCEPAACRAEAALVCRLTRIKKLICGFPALDGSNRRFGDAGIHWTGHSFKTETAPSIIATNEADVDVTGNFHSTSRVVDEGPSEPFSNCTEGTSCVEPSTDGTLHQVINYRDATPTYDETSVASCEAGTSYTDVPRNGGWQAGFDPTGNPPGEPSFARCYSDGGSVPAFLPDSEITATSGSWISEGSTEEGPFGGITYRCGFDEHLTYTLSDEITYDELAAAVAAVPVAPASEGGNTADCYATFLRFNDYQDDETIAVVYEPMSVAFRRVSPATGKIRCFFRITTYFPNLATPIDVQELSVVIEDGNDWSSDTFVEPDLYYPLDSTLGERLYMEVTPSPNQFENVVPDC